MAIRYEVIESKRWQHSDGRTASIYGALPWVSEADRAGWQVVTVGWTVRNPINGQVGIGRPPCKTRDEAIALAAKLGTPVSIGD